MDLRSGTITLGQVVKTPGARALIDKAFPGILNHPLAGRFMGLSLNQAAAMARGRVPQSDIDRLLRDLAAL